MTLPERMEAIKAALATALPARTVTRNLKDFSDRTRDELTAGVFTLVSLNEGEYENHNGREAMDGKHRMLLVGQIQIAEDAEPSTLEDAELAMVEDVKAFVRALPQGLCTLVMKGFAQSAQAEAPYGWVTINLEMSE